MDKKYYKSTERLLNWDINSYYCTDGLQTLLIRLNTQKPEQVETNLYGGDIGNNPMKLTPIAEQEFETIAQQALIRTFFMMQFKPSPFDTGLAPNEEL